MYFGTFHADPLYPGPQSDSHDIGVVVLDRPVRGIAPARLPAADSPSRLPTDQRFTSVGYGAYEVTNGPGGHRYLYGDSGGPSLLGRTQVVAAITITGDAVCRATNVTYRLDTASARSFLGQYVALP